MALRNDHYIKSITGLRIIAAYMVYMHHLLQHEQIKIENIFLKEFILSLNYGVSIFFVLSGFLISYRYSEYNFCLYSTWRNYIINRIARIYPLYFFLTVLTFVLSNTLFIDNNSNNYLAFCFNITLLKAFSHYYIFTGIEQGWSLTVEECFYFTAPLIFLFLTKTRLFSILFVAYLFGILFICFQVKIDHISFNESLRYMFTYTYFGRIAEFLIGACLSVYIYRKKTFALIHYSRIKTYLSLLIIVLLLCANVYLTQHKYCIKEYIPVTGILVAFINLFLLPICTAIFISGLITEKTIISKILSSKLFFMLGKSSYAFYLIHFGVIATVIERCLSFSVGLNFILLNSLSFLLFFIVEEPLNKKIRIILSKKEFALH